MKKIFLLTGIAALMLGSCIKDKGDYDYNVAEEPEVVLAPVYMATMVDGEEESTQVRANLVIDPEVTYSDPSKLRFTYTFPNPLNANEPIILEGDEDGSLNDPLAEIPNGSFDAMLTVKVLDDSGIDLSDNAEKGMEYYYDFKVILGATAYTTGSLVLVNDGGSSKLHFVTPDGQLFEDVYPEQNDGEEIPGTPKQLLFLKSFMGMPSLGYIILTDNSGTADGVVLTPDGLTKVRSMADNFAFIPGPGAPISPIVPESLEKPGNMIILESSQNAGVPGIWAEIGEIAIVINNTIHPSSTTPMMPPADPSAFYFGQPINGVTVQNLVKDRVRSADFFGVWGFDPVERRLRFFQDGIMRPMAPSAFIIDDVTPEWNVNDIQLDMVSLMFWNRGCCLIATDGSGYYHLAFDLVAKQNESSAVWEAHLSNFTKVPFSGNDLVTSNTKWIIDDNNGVVYFSSGNALYRYNAGEPEKLVDEYDGEVTMLRFKITQRLTASGMTIDYWNYNTLEVGTEGHLYRVDVGGAAGNRGVITSDIAMTGAPVDLYNRYVE